MVGRQELSDIQDETLVVRGGLMVLVLLRNSLETSKRPDGYYSLSFFGDDALSLEETCRAVVESEEGDLPHRRIRVSTVERLRAKGFEPFAQGYYPHLEIEFEISPTDERLEELISCFDDPLPNPLKET